MNYYLFAVLLIISVYFPESIIAAGRRPQQIEHTQCRLVFVDNFDEIRSKDRRARIEAYNVIQ